MIPPTTCPAEIILRWFATAARARYLHDWSPPETPGPPYQVADRMWGGPYVFLRSYKFAVIDRIGQLLQLGCGGCGVLV